jgi:hypothetical protein
VEGSADRTKEHEKILGIARKRFALAEEAEAENRDLALDDLRFAAGEQWDDQILRSRESDRRPCLVINRIPQFERQVINDIRQNRPSGRVSPVDDFADVETAKIYQGIVRHIERASDADTAYDTAGASAVQCGFGFFRVTTEYCDPMSFDQEIRIKRIRNRFRAYLDPASQEPDGSDANWGFEFGDLSIEDFKSQYPGAKASDADSWRGLGDEAQPWMGQDYVRVAEYFYKEFRDDELILIAHPDGRKESILRSELIEGQMLPPGAQVLSQRKTQVPVVHWIKMTGVEVLEETIWPAPWIPIIPVLGEERDIDGKVVREGIVRHAKDPQRIYNYMASSEAEAIALAPRAPYIGYEGQFKGYEKQWASANSKNHAYLEVKAVTVGGAPAPLPQRQQFEPAVQAITQARMLASDDMKATTGIYDAGLGAKSNEQSGVAIQRRNIQSQTSNFHFMDNLSKSIRHAMRMIVHMIPKIYDTERAIRILGEEGEEEIVRINQEFERNGELVYYKLGVGKYDVSVDTGPSFETKRQEAVASMLDLTRSYPQIMQVAGDLLVGAMDWPKAKELSERIKKTLDPNITEDAKNQKVPPQLQAQMGQMSQMIEGLTQKLNEAQDKLENKTLELESKERIEMQKLQVQLQIAMAQIDAKDSLAMFQAELAQIEGRMALLRFNEPIENETQEQEAPMAGPDGVLPEAQDQQPIGGPESPSPSMGAMP